MRRDLMIKPMMMTMTKRKKRTGPIMKMGLMVLGGLGGLERRARVRCGRRYMVMNMKKRCGGWLGCSFGGQDVWFGGKGFLRCLFRAAE